MDAQGADHAIRPIVVLRFLLSVTGILLLLNLASLLIRFGGSQERVLWAANLFNFDEESNVPTFYSGLLLLGASMLLLEIGLYKRQAGKRFAPQWLFLAGLFFYLAFDEVMQVHEQLIEPLRSLLAAHGVLYFAWIAVGGPLGILIAGLYFPFFVRLPRRVQVWACLGAGTYVMGAIGVEMVGGWYYDKFHVWDQGYFLITTVEETMEMVGISLFIRGLLEYMADNTGTIRLRVTR